LLSLTDIDLLMKRKIVKYISLFSICLAWLVINLHLIIPHDHHSSDLFGIKDDACPVSENQPVHNHGFPLHCHAFNDLTAEKFVKYIVSKNIQSDYISIDGFSDDVKFQGSPVTVSDSQQNFRELHLYDLSPLRAPPYLS
jgi:hypothetical protein